MTESSVGTTSAPRTTGSLYRGVLSLFQKTEQCLQYPFDQEQLTNATCKLRKSRKARRQGEVQLEEGGSFERNVTLADRLAKADITVLFFFHPTQPHSLKLRKSIANFCHQEHADNLLCIAIFGGDADAATPEENEDIKLFCQGTGFLNMSDTSETAILKFLDVTQIPSLIVIPNATGRPIMGQEVALEWNVEDSAAAEALLQRWKSGSSGLSLSQSMLAKTLGNSSSACNLM